QPTFPNGDHRSVDGRCPYGAKDWVGRAMVGPSRHWDPHQGGNGPFVVRDFHAGGCTYQWDSSRAAAWAFDDTLARYRTFAVAPDQGNLLAFADHGLIDSASPSEMTSEVATVSDPITTVVGLKGGAGWAMSQFGGGGTQNVWSWNGSVLTTKVPD